MNFRKMGRTGVKVSDMGHGLWGMSGWTGSEDQQSLESLQLSVNLGCNFFDTAWAYGQGHSDELIGRIAKQALDRMVEPAVVTRGVPVELGAAHRPPPEGPPPTISRMRNSGRPLLWS